jgi:hypothetical protein
VRDRGTNLQTAAFMQLLQLEKSFSMLDTFVWMLFCRGLKLAAIISPTLLFMLRCIAVVMCGILDVSLPKKAAKTAGVCW